MQDLTNFNPNGVGVVGGGFFSLPCSVEESRLVIISAPWDVTVSYGAGTAAAPESLREASAQLDLYDQSAPNAWREGIATYPLESSIAELSSAMRPLAEQIIERLESGEEAPEKLLAEVNRASEVLNKYIYETTRSLLEKGKIVALVGGDHSTPYGAIRAIAERYSDFGILHIDAHRDLRVAYEGFEFSHASIMYNVLRDTPQLSVLTQVAVRDFCDQEQELAESDPRIYSFEDLTLARGEAEGVTWAAQSQQIVATLPQDVYVSFDIDGLDISLCPHTGTPVPGGLSYNKMVYLLEEIVRSGRRIIGFDLVEVVPHESDVVDLAVGSRVLYKLCGLSIKSNNK